MTITMSEKIGSKKREKAAQMAEQFNENVAVVASEMNDKPIQMLFLVSVVENSPNRDKIEVIAVIDKKGNFVDIAD